MYIAMGNLSGRRRVGDDEPFMLWMIFYLRRLERKDKEARTQIWNWISIYRHREYFYSIFLASASTDGAILVE